MDVFALIQCRCATVLQGPTQSLEAINAAANQLSADGGTPMEAGMEKIREVLESVAGKRVAVVITDGQPNDVAQTKQRAQTLRALQIQIGTIPVGSDADKRFLQDISDIDTTVNVDDHGRGTAAAVLDILGKI